VKHRSFRIVLMSVLLLPISAVAVQTPVLDGEMKKLEFLVGEWKGEGREHWPMDLSDYAFTQKTKIEIKKNSLLRIKDEREYKPVSALLHSSNLDASISYDEESKLYSWKGRDSKVILEAKLIADKTFQFGVPFSVPFEPERRNQRTTIRITDAGEWHETNEIWYAGNWFVVKKSLLKKVK
jgi:hypothetical protein